MGVSITMEVSGWAAALAKINRFQNIETAELVNGLAKLGASQTQRRISSEKTSPSGAAWVANRAGTSTLFKTGSHLHDSIDHKASANQAEWGSGWIGARVHQYGAVIKPKKPGGRLVFSIGKAKIFAKAVNIPARPYLGLSESNASEMEENAVKFIESYMQ